MKASQISKAVAAAPIAKPMFDRKRPLSWSALSSFMWNKQQWYDKYVLGILQEKTPELIFGSMVDEKLQKNKKYLPDVVRYPIMQHRMDTVFNGIPLVGIADTFRPCSYCEGEEDHKNCERIGLRDYKTGRKPWDKKRADETGQLTMYCLLLWQIEKIRPEDVELHIDWLPTHYVDKDIAFIEPVKVQSFKTKRTMRQVADFGQFINLTYSDMIAYCENKTIAPPHVKVKNPLSSMLK